MRLLYEATESYEEDMETLVRLAFSCVPREHLRQLDGVYVTDFDPKGARLGVYERDHRGNRITLFLWPHVLDARRVPPDQHRTVLALHLGHTLFHEVGHHVTLTLNPRRAPSKKREQVTDTLEK
jgi:predicted Zn-dependent protease with MMP-like domain